MRIKILTRFIFLFAIEFSFYLKKLKRKDETKRCKMKTDKFLYKNHHFLNEFEKKIEKKTKQININ
jgi:hypothetical protein